MKFPKITRETVLELHDQLARGHEWALEVLAEIQEENVELGNYISLILDFSPTADSDLVAMAVMYSLIKKQFEKNGFQ